MKKIDRVTGNTLISRYPEADWVGAKGFRDIIAQQYFEIDPEQVFSILKHNLDPLRLAVKKMIQEEEA